MKNFLDELMEKEPEGVVNLKQFIKTVESGYTKNRGTKFTQKKTFSPSTLVYGNGSCPRYWFLAFTGADFVDNADAYAVANMASGTDAHARIQKAMEETGMVVENEKPVRASDPPIFGFADSIVQSEDRQAVVEIKTMREESFLYRKNAKPPNYHLMQLYIYMRILGKKIGILLYENKNTHELHAKTIEPTEQSENWLDYAFEWMKKVYAQYKTGEIPQKPVRSNAKICKSCPVADACAAADKGTLKIPVLEYLD